jgi:uncharacterized membrane protein
MTDLLRMDALYVDGAALAAILAMGVLTYLTRVGGFWLMGHVALSPRLERFLRHMAGGVLVSIVTAACVNGDRTMWAGLALAIAIMLWLRRPMTAMAAGMLLAAGLRLLGV